MKKIYQAIDENQIKSMLENGIQELNIDLDNNQLNKLVNYLKLLHKWNDTYNLTAIKNIKEMIILHIFDSLSVVPYVKNCKNILDVGSGGGLPGIVLAIVLPQLDVTLIDIVHKKTAFLRQVKAELDLKNVSVYTQRVENFSTKEKFEAIISRAFSNLSIFVGGSEHLLSQKGKFFAMKGIKPSDEIVKISEPWQVEEVKVLKVPYLDAERHIVIIKK